MLKYSIIIPAYNEEKAIGPLLKELLAKFSREYAEIIVVNDASKDGTVDVVKQFPVRLISNVQNSGYGYSLKEGIKAAEAEHIIIMDADGSYPVSAISTLVKEYEKGFDMVVGARKGVHYRGTRLKQIARFFFRILSEFATGRKIPDINSGCRIFRKSVVMKFFHTLSSGFSFTTTITLAFMLNAYSVTYLPIEYHKREGVSKVKYFRDTLRSTQIIVEAIIFYNPMKMFLLCSLVTLFFGMANVLLSIFFPWPALLLFLTLLASMLMLSLGFVTVFLKFMHNDRI
jgi:glycosyltransferase involved in cell wall biosynthesis